MFFVGMNHRWGKALTWLGVARCKVSIKGIEINRCLKDNRVVKLTIYKTLRAVEIVSYFIQRRE